MSASANGSPARRRAGKKKKIGDIDCPPYPLPQRPNADASILEHAAYVRAVANEYRAVMDSRGDFRATVGAASRLAAATDELTSAIADAVAEGDNRLS